MGALAEAEARDERDNWDFLAFFVMVFLCGGAPLELRFGAGRDSGLTQLWVNTISEL